MSAYTEPAGKFSPGPEPGFTSPNTLYLPILATVLLCGILITLFTAARLVTKRLISTYDVEDCEFHQNQSTMFRVADAKSHPDFLMMAWVDIDSAEAILLLMFPEDQTWLTPSRLLI